MYQYQPVRPNDRYPRWRIAPLIGYDAAMPSTFDSGDAVTITGGTFQGFTGTVDGPRDGGLSVLFTIFGRHTPIVVSLDLLRPKRPEDNDPIPPI
jgi:hypothetical protein